MANSSGITINLSVPKTKAVVRAIEQMEDDLFRKTVRSAVSKSTTPLKREYVRNIRKMDMVEWARESFAKSIIKRTKTYGKRVVVAIVGPANKTISYMRRSEFYEKTYPRKLNWAMLAHLFEFGVRPHTIGRGSALKRAGKPNSKEIHQGARHPGIKPQPVARPAFQKARRQSERIFRRVFTQGVIAAARKARARSGT